VPSVALEAYPAHAPAELCFAEKRMLLSERSFSSAHFPLNRHALAARPYLRVWMSDELCINVRRSVEW